MADDFKSNHAAEFTKLDHGQLVESLLNQFWDLIVTFAGRWDSVLHYRISSEIKAAVERGNREELLSRLNEFARAKNDFVSPKMESVMRGCSELTNIICEALSALSYDEIPWPRLANVISQAKIERDNLDRKIF